MKKKLLSALRQIADTVVMTAVIFVFLVTFVVQGYKVYGSCMEPNLRTGERLLGNKFIYRFEKPTRGDVVVFKYPPDPRKVFIKRIIALPGETVEIHEGKVYINGRGIDECPYVKNAPHGDFSPRKVPANHVFVLGDNRDESNDSRSWGVLPLDNIQAKAWVRYWPFSRLDVLP
ncbi:MAG TPA: signal peptidase I [Armatimonadota bacterium]|nr:signal peptidase I [Armatimonadota bacterium]